MSEVPEGFVEIEVVIDSNGKFKTKILRHGDKTACLNGQDDEILDGLIDGVGETEEYGHTEEFYEETKPDRNSQRLKPTDEAPFDEPSAKKKEQGLDLGYGV